MFSNFETDFTTNCLNSFLKVDMFLEFGLEKTYEDHQSNDGGSGQQDHDGRVVLFQFLVGHRSRHGESSAVTPPSVPAL